MADIEVTYRLTGNIPIADGSSYTTIDPTVTPTSDNPVKSSGIYQFVESELSNATDSQARSDIHDLTMEVNQLSLELSDKANTSYVDDNFATKQELNSKMEFYKIEYIGGALVHDGVSLNYSDIIAKYYDNKYFVYVEGDGYVYIPTLPPLEYDPIIEFSCNYIYNQKAYIARIIINENNQIKYEEVEVVRHDNAVLTVNNIGPDGDGNINVPGGGGVSINDNVIALDTTWSSSKINNNTNSALVPINEHLTNLDNNKADNSALIPINEHLTNLDNNKANNSALVNLETIINNMFIKPNAVITFTSCALYGYISGGQKRAFFSFPVGKSLQNVNNISTSTFKANIRTVNGDYLDNSSSTSGLEWYDTSKYAITLSINKQTNTIEGDIRTLTDFVNVPANNSPLVGLIRSATFTFS